MIDQPTGPALEVSRRRLLAAAGVGTGVWMAGSVIAQAATSQPVTLPNPVVYYDVVGIDGQLAPFETFMLQRPRRDS